MEQIFGTVERITFRNDENGFVVARLKLPRKTDLVTIVGTLFEIQPGEQVRCLGNWKNSSHGIQFEVKECHVEAPTDLAGIQKYLSSGVVKGIGPAFATRIVEKFGINTLEILEKDPEALLEVTGIGKKTIRRVKESWEGKKHIRNIILFLQQFDVTQGFAHKIYKNYGEEAIEKIKENPYNLARDIHGIGFKMTDALADRMGFSKDSIARIDSGIEFALLELSSEGHTCFLIDEFLKKASEMLQVDTYHIQARIEACEKEGRIVVEESRIWLKGLFLAEKGIARELVRLLNGKSHLREIDREKAIAWVESTLKITLADNQQEAVKQALSEKLHIITGGPGTGKSTITKAILAITSKLTRRIILAAPTGRAAKRMSEITRREASTIHSLLQYDFQTRGFRRNRENPLPADLLIIDESSMIDTSLMYHLLKATPDEARVLFVGDIHQLPSVGPGNVLKDMIESEAMGVTTLNKIFRQARGSKIITNAHRINEGRFPDLNSNPDSDFFFTTKESPEEVLEEILTLVTTRIPTKYKFDPITDIQVLSPMKKGALGTENLNFVLQSRLNPQKNFVTSHGSRFGVGDKVMQIKNNYTKEIFNGDIGTIIALDLTEEECVVSFDGKEIFYTFSELDELVLAYATSIHKYQGSEAPCIVIPIHTSHFMMLKRNLLYTGVTRGKKLVILVGNVKAIAIAVSTDDVKKRSTYLREQIITTEAKF